MIHGKLVGYDHDCQREPLGAGHLKEQVLETHRVDAAQVQHPHGPLFDLIAEQQVSIQIRNNYSLT